MVGSGPPCFNHFFETAFLKTLLQPFLLPVGDVGQDAHCFVLCCDKKYNNLTALFGKRVYEMFLSPCDTIISLIRRIFLLIN